MFFIFLSFFWNECLLICLHSTGECAFSITQPTVIIISDSIWAAQNGPLRYMCTETPLSRLHRPTDIPIAHKCWNTAVWHPNTELISFCSREYVHLYSFSQRANSFQDTEWLLLKIGGELRWMMRRLGGFWLQWKIASWCELPGSDLDKRWKWAQYCGHRNRWTFCGTWPARARCAWWGVVVIRSRAWCGGMFLRFTMRIRWKSQREICSQMDLHLLLGLFSCSLEQVLLWTVVYFMTQRHDPNTSLLSSFNHRHLGEDPCDFLISMNNILEQIMTVGFYYLKRKLKMFQLLLLASFKVIGLGWHES